MKGVIGAIVALALLGCELFEEDCSLIIANNMQITLRDSVTNDPIVADSIVVITTDGAYADTIRLSMPVLVSIPQVRVRGERAGTYRVQVTATGYAPWVREGVRVVDEGCHIRTVDLTARMQRLGST